MIIFTITGLIPGSVATAEAKQTRPLHHERTAPTQNTTADEAPVRSGTIVTGSAAGLAGGVPPGCAAAPDCRAWVASGCDSDLAGRDPALVASIEDVADLALHSRIWNFQHDPGGSAYATIQLWRRNCTEIGSRRSGSGGCEECFIFKIPRSAMWMTVTGYTYNPWASDLPGPDGWGPMTFDWALSSYTQRVRS